MAGVCAGCQRAANAPVAQNTLPARDTLHVTSVTPDAVLDVTGILNGKEYALSVDRSHVPPYVAYYEPIDLQDVSKDFPAKLEESSNELVVQVPRGAVRYAIKSVREKN